MNHYIQIHEIIIHPESGKHSVVHRIGLYTADGKWVKWVSVDRCRNILKSAKILVSDEVAKKMQLVATEQISANVNK